LTEGENIKDKKELEDIVFSLPQSAKADSSLVRGSMDKVR